MGFETWSSDENDQEQANYETSLWDLKPTHSLVSQEVYYIMRHPYGI